MFWQCLPHSIRQYPAVKETEYGCWILMANPPLFSTTLWLGFHCASFTSSSEFNAPCPEDTRSRMSRLPGCISYVRRVLSHACTWDTNMQKNVLKSITKSTFACRFSSSRILSLCWTGQNSGMILDVHCPPLALSLRHSPATCYSSFSINAPLSGIQ